MRKRLKTKEEVAELWESIKSAFKVIYNLQTSSLKYQDLFDIFHIITVSKFGHLIKEKLEESFQEIMDDIILLIQVEDSRIIKIFCDNYNRYMDLVDKIKKIAVYYDSRYVLNHKDSSPSSLIGYLKFRDNFLESGLQNSVIEQLLKMIRKVRSGDHTDKLLIRQAIQIFVSGNLDSDINPVR